MNDQWLELEDWINEQISLQNSRQILFYDTPSTIRLMQFNETLDKMKKINSYHACQSLREAGY